MPLRRGIRKTGGACKARIEKEYKRPFFTRITRDFVFRKLLPFPARIRLAANLLRFINDLACRLSPVKRHFEIAWSFRRGTIAATHRTAIIFTTRLGRPFRHKARSARVWHFLPAALQMSPLQGLNEATIRVLTANGCEVVVPNEQLCCGALASHAGVRETARELARKNIAVFEAGDF